MGSGLTPQPLIRRQTSCRRLSTCRVAVGLYKRFVCVFGDCALVNTIIGIQHLLDCNPPLLNFVIDIAQDMVPPRPPLCCHSTYNTGNGNIV